MTSLPSTCARCSTASAWLWARAPLAIFRLGAAQNKLCAAEPLDGIQRVNARDKVVVVLGGGDTGSDCVGTARRQRAKKIYQLEILPKPPETRPVDTPWPTWPRIMRTSSSHEEGCERRWSSARRSPAWRQCEKLRLQWSGMPAATGSSGVEPIRFESGSGSALGFLHVTHEGLVQDLGLQLDAKGNVIVDRYQTSEPLVFAAGDTVSGASLVVRAINSGREAAAAMDRWLRQNPQ
jgi:NADPH-dependent glutamate synthase beta subunit-like oxidoreductase